MAYLDDIVGVVHPHQANNALLTITHLLQHLGLPSNEKKVEPPSHKILCLGIEIDAKRGTLSIPVDKLQKITKTCHVWVHKHRATRHQVQRLVGHLIYIHKCIPPARLFVNRILCTLRSMPTHGYRELDRNFYKDIAWFCQFLETFNGTAKIHPINVQRHVIFVNASLKGMGAINNNKVYAMKLPRDKCKILSIVHLEAANILVALTCCDVITKW